MAEPRLWGSRAAVARVCARSAAGIHLVGLTGGIASGKSTAARLFEAAGARVVDADAVARQVVALGTPALAEIRDVFGAGVFAADGTLDRKALAALVFADPRRRALLNRIVHPRVEAAVTEAIEAIRREEPGAVVVYDVPLLFETGMQDRFDLVVLVYLPRELQISRLLKRDGLTVDEVQDRLDSQQPLDQKAALADVVLDNRGSVEDLAGAIEALMALILARNPPRGAEPSDLGVDTGRCSR